MVPTQHETTILLQARSTPMIFPEILRRDSRKGAVLGSAALLTSSSLTRMVSLFILTILLGRSAGAASLGEFSIILAAASALQAISTGGLAGAAVHRLLSSGGDFRAELQIIGMARALLIPIVFSLGGATYFWLMEPVSGPFWCLVFFVGYAVGAFDVGETGHTASGRFRTIGGRRMVVLLAVAVPKFWAAFSGEIEAVLILQSLEAAAWQAALVPGSGFVNRGQRTRILSLARNARMQLWGVRSLWLSSVASTLAQRIDLFIVGALLTSFQVGQFSTASRPVEAAVIVAVSLVAVMFNRLVAQSGDAAAYAESNARIARIVSGVALAVTGAFIVGGPWLISMLYGPDFEGAASVIGLYAISTVFVFQRQLISRLLIIEHLYNLSLWNNLAALSINVVLNIALIPIWGIWGAATAAVLTHPLSLGIFLLKQDGRRILKMAYGPLVSRSSQQISTASQLISERRG